MRNLIVLLLPIILLTSACETQKARISRLWFYTYGNKGADDGLKLNPANFLQLRPDGTFTSDLGAFDWGSWAIKDKQLVLTGESSKPVSFTIDFTEDDDLKLSRGKDSWFNFDSKPLPEQDDPFGRVNNRWRIPATHPETDEALRHRLQNHCKFWEAYFAWAMESKSATVDVRSTPTPIKVYGNGFALKSFEDLPPTWVGYFYDTADCRRANAILEAVFRKNDIAWAHTDNKFKMFLAAFQQMDQLLD